MFTELGLNVARQPDNGSRPRPDNRTGWLEGAAPADLVVDEPDEPETPLDLHIRLWDPSSQLRFKRKTSVPARPDGAPNAWPSQAA
jgi:biotin synthase